MSFDNASGKRGKVLIQVPLHTWLGLAIRQRYGKLIFQKRPGAMNGGAIRLQEHKRERVFWQYLGFIGVHPPLALRRYLYSDTSRPGRKEFGRAGISIRQGPQPIIGISWNILCIVTRKDQILKYITGESGEVRLIDHRHLMRTASLSNIYLLIRS